MEAPGRAPQAAATEGLYERHAAKILAYCRHQLGSREEAEDAVQTTFMNAFRALGRGVVPEAESAWLFKIAENVCLSRRRSSWRRGRIESPSDFEVIEEVVPGPSRQRDELIGIEDALASMPEQQRRAILLREWQGLSYREIADELEVSQSAVETLIFRARRSLAQGLEQPDTLKKPKRKAFRRALHMIDVGTLAAAAKTLLAGSAAVKATAAAVAVTAAAGTAAGVAPKLEGKRHGTVPVAAAAPAQQPGPAPAAAAAPPARGVLLQPARTTAAPAAPAAAPVAGPVRKPKKRAEKAAAKPPVHDRVAPAAVPVAAVPAPAAAPVPAPVAAEPVPAPAPTPVPVPAEPVAAAVAPTHTTAAPPSKDREGTKQDEGKAHKDARKENGKGKGRAPQQAAPAALPPAPPAVVLPVSPVASDSAAPTPAPADAAVSKQERRQERKNAKRGLAAAPTPAEPTAAAPATEPVAEPAAAPEAAPAEEPAAESGERREQRGEGKKRRR